MKRDHRLHVGGASISTYGQVILYILIGGRADGDFNGITQVDVRAPANQNASNGDRPVLG